MTSRNLLKPLSEAGKKIRDQAITQTGESGFIRYVQKSTPDRYNMNQANVLSSPHSIILIPLWDQRLVLEGGDLSEEEDQAVEAHARFCDFINKGSIITLDIYNDYGERIEENYEVVRIDVDISEVTLSKKIVMVPYRGRTY